MPWQELVADVAGELRPDGLPQYRSVVVTVPRQSGKTTVARAFLVERLERPKSEELAMTAQTRLAARQRLFELGLQAQNELDGFRLMRSIGSEAMEANGSRLSVFSPTGDSGHGSSLALVLLDEVFALDELVLGGLVPAQAAIADAQRIGISTQGTEDSTVLNRWTAQGRERCEDPDTTTAYFEWSAPDDVDVLDPAAWPLWMPALGHTISVDSIRADIVELSEREAIRAYGNRMVPAEEPGLELDRWLDQADPGQAPDGRVALAVDVNVGPNGGSIAAAWRTEEGGLHAELTDARGGSLEWIPSRVEAICQSRGVVVVALDPYGPAGSLEPDLRALCDRWAIPFRPILARERSASDGFLWDGIRGGSITFSPSDPLEFAIRGAVREGGEDRWRLSRKRSRGDVSPLIAVSHALFVANEADVSRAVPAIY